MERYYHHQQRASLSSAIASPSLASSFAGNDFVGRGEGGASGEDTSRTPKDDERCVGDANGNAVRREQGGAPSAVTAMTASHEQEGMEDDGLVIALADMLPLPEGFDEWSVPRDYRLLRLSPPPPPSPSPLHRGSAAQVKRATAAKDEATAAAERERIEMEKEERRSARRVRWTFLFPHWSHCCRGDRTTDAGEAGMDKDRNEDNRATQSSDEASGI